MPDNTLFENGQKPTAEQAQAPTGTPRVARPIRDQMELIPAELDSLIPDDHQVRTLWAYVEQADLSAWYAHVRVVEGGAGRTAIDPRILLGLWLYATIDGVGSARALAQLCLDHIVYRWLCGGVSVNYHTLSDFRSNSEEELDDLLTDSVARLRAAGAVTLNRLAHDGMRVRASAGSGSFRRLETLERYREEARARVAALRQELESDPSACRARQKAARERAARERLERVEEALRQYPEVKAQKKHDKDQARVSVTDPDARKMHMADGGFRPAVNVQFTTDTASQIIAGVGVIQSGSDGGQLRPAVEQVKTRYEKSPSEMLVDGGFAKKEDVEVLSREEHSCTVYAPWPKHKKKDNEIIGPQPEDSTEVHAWYARMQTSEAKEIYKERAATAECVNALARNRGMQQFFVRGVKKIKSVVLLFVVVHNMCRGNQLLPAGWAGLRSKTATCRGSTS